MKMHWRLFLFGAVVAFCAAPLIAQNPDTTKLSTVVVSASTVPRPATELSQAVTVISGADLRARGVQRVSDALREVPGAMLVQSGSYGSVTSLFLRGGESRYTKVLVDGVPVNADGGFFDFSHLTTDNIDRIEIVRGPASVLYGADAASGIVQIFTRKPTAERRASLSARGGTYHTVDVAVDGSGSAGPTGLSFGAAHHSTAGILPFNNQYQNGTLSSALKLGTGPAGEATVSARYTAADFHYPTDFNGQPVDSNAYRVQHRLTVGLDAVWYLTSYAQARFLAGDNEVTDVTDDIATPFGATEPQHSASTSREYRREADARLSFFLPTSATITLGAGYQKERENSSNGAGPVGGTTSPTDSFRASRENFAYYTELLGSPAEKFSYTISGRVDDNSDYRRFATYRLGANVHLLRTVIARASLSTAFNAPAFSELRPTLFTVGSPDLSPERIRAAEIGIQTNFRPDLFVFSADYFAQRFSDLIQYVAGGPPGFLGSYANLTGASSNGWEAEVAVFPAGAWRANVSYTIVNPRVTEIPTGYQGTDMVGEALLRRPSHSGSVVLTYMRSENLSLGAAASYVGKRPDTDFSVFPSPRVTLPAYAKLDLSADVPVVFGNHNGIALNARLENAFNKFYEDVLHFRAPGRTLLIGARVSTLF
ncbi:MAG: TonB-dependent receptor plug domain-containing protein [Gemmatimonadaceae bacterium]